MKNKFIVAEITKNWPLGSDSSENLLSQKFELVINTNLERGYTLKDWKMHNFINDNKNYKYPMVTETIIAVFELIEVVQGSHPKVQEVGN